MNFSPLSPEKRGKTYCHSLIKTRSFVNGKEQNKPLCVQAFKPASSQANKPTSRGVVKLTNRQAEKQVVVETKKAWRFVAGRSVP
jgi:hypothetical protein